MFRVLRNRVRRLCSRLRRLLWRKPKPKVVIRRFGKLNSKAQVRGKRCYTAGAAAAERPIRLATFNVALFTLAPAIPFPTRAEIHGDEEDYVKIGSDSSSYYPKSILKQSPLHPATWMGELNFYCTQLDHLDENWRMKQINAIIQSSDHQPHILAGGINSLDSSDYSHFCFLSSLDFPSPNPSNKKLAANLSSKIRARIIKIIGQVSIDTSIIYQKKKREGH